MPADDAAGDDSAPNSPMLAGNEAVGTDDGGRPRGAFLQKLWTEADEVAILQGFLEFVAARGTTHSDYQHGTAPFFEAVKPRLSAPFSTPQLVEKLRRLKRKYRNTAARIADSANGAGGARRRRAFAFRSAHEEAKYEISRKIWSPIFQRGRTSMLEAQRPDLGAVGTHSDAPRPADGAVLALSNARDAVRLNLESSNGHEEAPRTDAACVGDEAIPNLDASSGREGHPVKAEEVQEGRSNLFPGLVAVDPLWPIPEASLAVGRRLEGRWKEQRILELEVYLKRVELIRDRVVERLDELRRHAPANANVNSSGTGGCIG